MHVYWNAKCSEHAEQTPLSISPLSDGKAPHYWSCGREAPAQLLQHSLSVSYMVIWHTEWEHCGARDISTELSKEREEYTMKLGSKAEVAMKAQESLWR